MNKTITIGIVSLIIIGGLLYYFFTANNNPTPTQGNTPTTTSDNTNTSSGTPVTTEIPEGSKGGPVSNTVSNTVVTPQVTNVTIDIRNFLFNPSTITIKKGTRVTWTNSDTVPHTVTSDSGNLLNSPTLSLGQSFSFTFTGIGTVKYHCSIHPRMLGTIIVTN